jgi:Fic family protein
MRRYNWEQDDWPNFTFTLTGVEDDLITFSEKLGRVTGAVDALPMIRREKKLPVFLINLLCRIPV